MHIDYTLQTVTFSGDNKTALQKMVETIRSNLSRFPKSSWERWKMQMCFPDNTVQFEGSDLEYDYDPKKGCWPVEVEIIEVDLIRCSNAISENMIDTPRYYIDRTINYERLASIWCRLCRLTSDCSVEVLSPYFVHLKDHYTEIKEQIGESKCQEKNTLRREILRSQSFIHMALNRNIDSTKFVNEVKKAVPDEATYLSITAALPVLATRRKWGFKYLPHLGYFQGHAGLEKRIKEYKELVDLYGVIVKPYLDRAHENILKEVKWCAEILKYVDNVTKNKNFVEYAVRWNGNGKKTTIDNVLARIPIVFEQTAEGGTRSSLIYALHEIWPELQFKTGAIWPEWQNPDTGHYYLEYFTRLEALVEHDTESKTFYTAQVKPFLTDVEVPKEFIERYSSMR
jgi:hypothetical protein